MAELGTNLDNCRARSRRRARARLACASRTPIALTSTFVALLCFVLTMRLVIIWALCTTMGPRDLKAFYYGPIDDGGLFTEWSFDGLLTAINLGFAVLVGCAAWMEWRSRLPGRRQRLAAIVSMALVVLGLQLVSVRAKAVLFRFDSDAVLSSDRLLGVFRANRETFDSYVRTRRRCAAQRASTELEDCHPCVVA